MALLCSGLLISGAGAASAEGPDRPGGGSGDVGTMGYEECQGQYVFANLKVHNDRIGRVGSPQSNYYGSGGTMSLSTGYNGSVTATVSGTVSVEAKAAMLATVKAEVNSSVATSVGVSMTNTASFEVPAGRWGNAVYGRYRIAVTGDSYRLEKSTCRALGKKTVTYYVSGTDRPQGWCTWTSTTSLGQRPSQCNDGSPFVP